MQSRRIARGIARNFHRRIEPQHVAALVFHPQRVGRNYRRAAVRGDFGKAHAGAGGHAEEIDEHAGLERRVLVDQDADFVIAGERFQDRPREILFENHAIAAKAAAALHQPIDHRIVERPHQYAHGPGGQPVRERTQLPIPQVRRGEQHAAALAEGGIHMLGSLDAYPQVQVVWPDGGKPGKADQQSCDRAEHTIDDRATPGRIELRQRQHKIPLRHPPQARDPAVQQPRVVAPQRIGRGNRRPLERLQNHQCKRIFDPVPKARAMRHETALYRARRRGAGLKPR